MISEWLNIMLEEIARKKAEAEQAGLEEQRRRDESPGLVVESAPYALDKNKRERTSNSDAGQTWDSGC